MNEKMKIAKGLITLLLLGLLCCQKGSSGDYQSIGKITGPDLRMCVCCGGWQIVIDSISYNFNAVPANSNIDLQKETFPLFVKLDWELAGPTNCPKWITIQRMIKE